jgi:hypothetical protein
MRTLYLIFIRSLISPYLEGDHLLG